MIWLFLFVAVCFALLLVTSLVVLVVVLGIWFGSLRLLVAVFCGWCWFLLRCVFVVVLEILRVCFINFSFNCLCFRVFWMLSFVDLSVVCCLVLCYSARCYCWMLVYGLVGLAWFALLLFCVCYLVTFAFVGAVYLLAVGWVLCLCLFVV